MSQHRIGICIYSCTYSIECPCFIQTEWKYLREWHHLTVTSQLCQHTSCHVHTKQMGIVEVFWQFSWSWVLEMLLRWILLRECPEEASLHTVPVKPYRDTPISQQAEHYGWHLLSQHGRMIGPCYSLPSLPLIMASAERMLFLDHPGGVSAPWEHYRVGDLSSAPVMRLKFRRNLKRSPQNLFCG